MKKLGVGILGATGIVGEQYVRWLINHPFFEIAFLAASQESAGKSYAQALAQKGRGVEPFPDFLEKMSVHRIDQIDQAKDVCDFVFSALATETASVYETQYASAGMAVVSNTSCHRKEGDVPVVIPELNPDHLKILSAQQKNRGWNKGFIVAKPNCSVQSYLIPLYPLHQKFGIKKLLLTTLQAVSGAGYPGVSSLDMIDNLIPYISGEEEKSETEPLKILGKIQGGKIVSAEGISISAHCNRVPVMDGHTACVSVQFEKKPSQEEILKLWGEFKGSAHALQLPSAPERLIRYQEEKDRPQPRLDRNAGKGMTVTVGRLRECPLLDYRFVALSHNALRGAAGGGVLNGELLYALGYLGNQ